MEKYSVLMPVYYREQAEYLCRSVQSMLDQTVPPAEFVIVCDGPLTEALDGVIAEFEKKHPELFRVVRLPENRGLGIALQQGLLACRHELVARMDSDDFSLPDRIEKQLRFLQEHPDVTVVGGQIAEFSGTMDNIVGYRQVPELPEDVFARVGRRNPMNHMTVMMRKSRVQEAGGYQDITFFEDYHLWTRLLAADYRMANLRDICCYVRVDNGMYSRRGGWAYFRNTMQVERLLLEKKLISRWLFFQNLLIRFSGVVVVPNQLRARLYKIMLRKPSLNE